MLTNHFGFLRNTGFGQVNCILREGRNGEARRDCGNNFAEFESFRRMLPVTTADYATSRSKRRIIRISEYLL